MIFPHDVDGWLTEAEGEVLHRLAKDCKVLEIGTYAGRSAICMAQSAQLVVCCDTFDGRGSPNPRETLYEFRGNLNKYNLENKCLIFIGDVRETVPMFDDRFDLIFIDGAHDLASIQKDLENAETVLTMGGIIAVHDYAWPTHPDVKKAVDQWREKAWGYETVDSLFWTTPLL